MNIRYSVIVLLFLAGLAAAARVSLSSHSDMVVRIDAAKGAVLVRDAHTGRVKAFHASAAEIVGLKVGDEVKANWKTGALTELKGAARTLPLIEPDPIEPCCSVVAVIQDQAAAQALLGTIFGAEPTGSDLRRKIVSVDAVKGIQADFRNELNGAEPISGIILARDNATGALHALNASVLSENETGMVAAPIVSSVKIGDRVSIDAATGIGMVRSGSGLYAFNLRGVKKDAGPAGSAQGPWVVEPDPKAEGRYGLLRTVWLEKSAATYQNVYVYLPGKRDEAEYKEHFKVQHSILEGEYDVFISSMLLEKVPIKAGHATRILMGGIRYTGQPGSILRILDTKDRKAAEILGGEVVSLPIGTYHVKVGTRTMKIEVKESQITDF